METTQSNKGKLIAWFVVIAAVVIVYVVMTAKAHNAQASTNTTDTTATVQSADTPSSQATSITSYKDGTYTASENYDVPHGVEGLSVTLTIKDGAIAGTSIQQSGGARDSLEYQQAFSSGYQSYVVGKKLSDINLNRVSGASLTSEAFNQALSQIEAKAQA